MDSGNKYFYNLSDEIYRFSMVLLDEFNSRNMALSELPPHKRIYLFFLTRAVKTYSAIALLCREGYGQDVATLLRGLFENLVSTHYIMADPFIADAKAIRFVDYKWVIFKRYIEQDVPDERESIEDLLSNRGLVMERFHEFKKKYNILSDRGLLTWSGRSIKDMARLSGNGLVEEYNSVFRACSRFSHLSIIGDREYLDHKDQALTFSPLPSAGGIVTNLRNAMRYMIDFLEILDTLFYLRYEERIKDLKFKEAGLCEKSNYSYARHPGNKPLKNTEKGTNETIIKFNIAGPQKNTKK